MIRRSVPVLSLLLLLLSLPGSLPAEPPRPRAAKKPAAVPIVVTEALRRQVAMRINEERSRAGVPPLATSDPLDQVAQSRADEIAAKGALPDEAESLRLLGRVQLRLTSAGYKAHGWTESLTVTAGDLDEVMDYWKQDPSYRQAMGRDYQDVGIGVADFDGVPLYTFLFAWPKSEFYARQTAELTGADSLARMRAEMLERVNAERRAAGLAPLAADPRLDVAAQRHAEDMLARTYYSHNNPEGLTPRQRLLEAGFDAVTVGENIAAGHLTAAAAMDAWLHSSGHRRNILEPGVTHLGVGLAVGSYEHRYQVLWVQDFGKPLPPPAP